MCPTMWNIAATWRIRLNLCFLCPTGVHNPNGKSIGSTVSAQLTAESYYTLQWATFSHKIAPSSSWGSGSHLIHDSLCETQPTIQTTSLSVQPFSHRWPQISLYFTMGRPKICWLLYCPQCVIEQDLSSSWDGRLFGDNRHGPKIGGSALWGSSELAPI